MYGDLIRLPHFQLFCPSRWDRMPVSLSVLGEGGGKLLITGPSPSLMAHPQDPQFLAFLTGLLIKVMHKMSFLNPSFRVGHLY